VPRFEVAQKVSWNPNADARHLANMKKQHGDGPFHVQAIRDVPAFCNCGAIDADHTNHEEGCNLARTSLRPQFVILKTKQGWRQFAAEIWMVPVS